MQVQPGAARVDLPRRDTACHSQGRSRAKNEAQERGDSQAPREADVSEEILQQYGVDRAACPTKKTSVAERAICVFSALT